MINTGKLLRPPTVENWSRMQHPEVNRTAKKLFSFIRGGPSWNYQPTRNVARYYVEDRIDRATGLQIVGKAGSALGRPHNRQAVEALFDFFESNPLDGVKAFDQMVEWFPLGPDVLVPIKPLTVIRMDGHFAPIFVNPWAEIALDDYQASLYMSVLERSIFRLTDFEDSPGKIIFLPKKHDAGKREAVVWKRGDYPQMSDTELNEQIRVFTEGRVLAARWAEEHNLRYTQT